MLLFLSLLVIVYSVNCIDEHTIPLNPCVCGFSEVCPGETVVFDLDSISRSDACYYIIKFNTTEEGVDFCLFTRSIWHSRPVKNIIEGESACNALFEKYSKSTLHDVTDPNHWKSMKGCKDRYDTAYSVLKSSKDASPPHPPSPPTPQNKVYNTSKARTVRDVFDRVVLVGTHIIEDCYDIISLTHVLICPIGQMYLNIGITVLKVMTFGNVHIPYTDLRCKDIDL